MVEVEHFVARVEELAQIHSALESHDRFRKTAVVHGLGGMGKTQLAVAYAKLHRDDYSAVFWMNAKDEASLRQTYANAANRILYEHPTMTYLKSAVEEGDINQVVHATKRWLSQPRNSHWLVIYDNYDTPDLGGEDLNGSESDVDADECLKYYDIRPFFPDSHHGAIIITTRSARVKIGRCIPLGKLRQMIHSLEILSNASNRHSLALGM